MVKSVTSDGDSIYFRGKSGGVQRRRIRHDGWTARRRAIFLDHLAATCNVEASAKAAGPHVATVYALRRRDPDFAAQWRAALESGFDRLQAMLIERAMGPMVVAIGETPVPDAAQMDTALAMQLIEHHRRTITGAKMRRGGPVQTRATEEETNAAILKRLKVLHRRMLAKAEMQNDTSADNESEGMDA